MNSSEITDTEWAAFEQAKAAGSLIKSSGVVAVCACQGELRRHTLALLAVRRRRDQTELWEVSCLQESPSLALEEGGCNQDRLGISLTLAWKLVLAALRSKAGQAKIFRRVELRRT